ncbi:MAG: c-type cytochrome [Elusimicrobiota bacterium]
MNILVTLLLAVNAAAQAPAAPDAGATFKAKCTACHAKDGTGSPSMAKMFQLKDPSVLNLTSDATRKKADADLIKTITDGRGKMPSFKGKLKDAEIAALVAYLRALPAPGAKAPAGK